MELKKLKPKVISLFSGCGGTYGYHFPEPRALTNRERARIQSFPDSFEFIGSFGEVRRQIGNAVPPEGAKPIAKAIMKMFRFY